MKRQFVIGATLVLVIAAVAQAQTVLYVDQNADQTPHDGSDWGHAFVLLQDAAQPGATIRVADGTYLPTKQSEEGVARTETFLLLSGVTLEGGYAGYAAANPDERDAETNETILSGDIGVVGDVSDNCFHVVAADGVDETTVLDGFVIADGSADGDMPFCRSGAGARIDGGAPAFVNCRFKGNTASVSGGGVLCNASAAVFIDCVFEGNAGGDGAGMQADAGDVRLERCEFRENTGRMGAGAHGVEADLEFVECVFSGNSASYYGAACVAGGRGSFVDCMFVENTSASGGGAYVENGEASFDRCRFVGNTTGEYRSYGGGVQFSFAEATLTNCTFAGNVAGYYGGGVYSRSGMLTLTNCTFTANSAVRNCGGGIGLRYGAASLADCTFSDNLAGDDGHGVYNYAADVSLANCVLWGNGAEGDASLIYGVNGAVTAVSYCCTQGGSEGEGNIDADPLFVDADGVDDIPGTLDDDLRLQSGSPCIDAGDDNAVTPLGLADLDGYYRFFDDPATADTGLGVAPIVDMGAYEYGSTAPPLWGDLNCDGAVNAFDIDPFVIALVDSDAYAAAYPHCDYGLADCNGDGLVNAFDIDAFVTILVRE